MISPRLPPGSSAPAQKVEKVQNGKVEKSKKARQAKKTFHDAVKKLEQVAATKRQQRRLPGLNGVRKTGNGPLVGTAKEFQSVVKNLIDAIKRTGDKTFAEVVMALRDVDSKLGTLVVDQKPSIEGLEETKARQDEASVEDVSTTA